jgi:hypothetical protein
VLLFTVLPLQDSHAPRQPPDSLSSSGHCDVMSATHRGPLLHPDDPWDGTGTGRKSMGTLKPSTTVMSKKSMLPGPPTVNSAIVMGGWPLVLHASTVTRLAGLVAGAVE